MFTLDLPSGIKLEIGPLWLEETYAGVLEGYPHARANDLIIDRVRHKAERLFPGQPFFLARPYLTRVPQDHEPSGPRIELPRILCIGLAKHVEGATFSTMALAWFQPDPAPPVPDEVREELGRVDWQLANFFEL